MKRKRWPAGSRKCSADECETQNGRAGRDRVFRFGTDAHLVASPEGRQTRAAAAHCRQWESKRSRGCFSGALRQWWLPPAFTFVAGVEAAGCEVAVSGDAP